MSSAPCAASVSAPIVRDRDTIRRRKALQMKGFRLGTVARIGDPGARRRAREPVSRPPRAVIHALFGPAVSPEVAALLEVGLEELSADELTRLADDLWRAQTMLIGAAFRAATESGRVTAVAPDTVAELLNPEPAEVRLRINPPEDLT